MLTQHDFNEPLGGCPESLAKSENWTVRLRLPNLQSHIASHFIVATSLHQFKIKQFVREKWELLHVSKQLITLAKDCLQPESLQYFHVYLHHCHSSQNPHHKLARMYITCQIPGTSQNKTKQTPFSQSSQFIEKNRCKPRNKHETLWVRKTQSHRSTLWQSNHF